MVWRRGHATLARLRESQFHLLCETRVPQWVMMGQAEVGDDSDKSSRTEVRVSIATVWTGENKFMFLASSPEHGLWPVPKMFDEFT